MRSRAGTRERSGGSTAPARLFDLTLLRSADGTLHHAGGAAVGPADLADIVRRSGGATDDVRVLLDHGWRDRELFRALADLLGRDVLVTPDGAVLPDPHEPVPVHVDDGRLADWRTIQPPALVTDLPGWFDCTAGTVRVRDGLVALALPGGLAFSTRENYVTQRAAVARLGAAPDGLVTVAVPVQAGGFLLTAYSGTRTVAGAEELAAALATFPLYAGDLRLWLAWPSEPAERQALDRHLTALADVTGATVWVPPTGGSVAEQGGDLVVRDRDGRPDAWWPYRPSGVAGIDAFRSDADGRLIPAATPVTAGDDEDRSPYARSVVPSVRATGPRPHGVSWLAQRPPVNAEAVTLYVGSPWPPDRVDREGLPVPDVYVLGHGDPRDVPGEPAGYLLRLRVEPGSAVPAEAIVGAGPVDLRPVLARPGVHLLPAGWADAARLEAGYAVDPDGAPAVEAGLPGHRLTLRSTGAAHGVDGVPASAARWPGGPGEKTAYALLSESDDAPGDDLLPLHHDMPEVRPGHRLAVLRVPAGAAFDVPAGADQVAPLTSLRTVLPDLLLAGMTVVLPRSAYGTVRVTGVHVADGTRWRSGPEVADRPLATLLGGDRADPGP